MTTRSLFAGLALLALAGAADAGDLKALPRSIAKQPTYAEKPAYALLVFGPEAKSRVWIVVDGATLYVDKNGNGDLTEAGEKISPTEAPQVEENEAVKVSTTEFEIGDLPAAAGATAYQGLFVSRSRVEPKPGAPADVKASDSISVSVSFRDTCEQTAHPDLAASPQAAGVVHFDGPLMAMVDTGCDGCVTVLHSGEEAEEINIQIGTQGVGAGTWAPMGHGPVPEGVKPVLEITFPAATAGAPAIVEKYTLDERC